ncbi:glycosyltransferase family 2 protein [Microbacterium stercoris]|uniref:Glycosyltransferase family 2 protein n=1 Tax=Microbacterium stercoris TaxID=2820289 RepID=A0A939QL87_9MICO|nr:glycosyltransferase family 2 protein [Microbacterium stercoris]MBO3664972.1 glycosyltransferase family 2 protein [Microbacterium stercoris]
MAGIDRARVMIVVPAFNEREAVGAVVAEINEVMPEATVVVVDDASHDDTAAVASAAGATVLRLPVNLGVGGAMRAGFRLARERGFDVVVQVDGDGQHPARAIPELIGGLDEADVVIGARFAGGAEYEARGPRRWAMWLLAHAVSAVARTRLTDATSGFKAAGPRAVRLFAHTYPAEYLGDTVEALVIAARSGLVIRQLPVSMRPRQGGVPSQGVLSATRHLVRASLAFCLALFRPAVPLEEVS